jgi:hypothetical protein
MAFPLQPYQADPAAELGKAAPFGASGPASLLTCTITRMNPLAGVLGEAWKIYRSFAAPLLAIAFAIYLAAAIIIAMFSLAGIFGSLLGAIVQLVAAFLVQAALVKAIQDVRDGRADLSLGKTVRAATPSTTSVAGASTLAGIAITIALVLVIVPGLILITIWAVIVPAIVIERAGLIASFGRSRELVRGHGWQVFGAPVLVFLILIDVNIVIELMLLAQPLALRNGISSLVSGTLVTPFLAAVVTLSYYRLVDAHSGPGQAGGHGQRGCARPGGRAQPPSGPGSYGPLPRPPGGDPEGGGQGESTVPSPDYRAKAGPAWAGRPYREPEAIAAYDM